MKIPASLLPLVDDGIIEEVLRPLMSGKEAQVYLVVAGGQERIAKVYKNALHRSFKNKADYTEGRRTRNSRDQRALARRSKHGREQDEASWRSTEVDMIYRLRSAGVRVPEPYIYSDGVLVMEFITDADGFPAPRLGDVDLDPDHARRVFENLIQEVVRMLRAGVVHADLSDFNVLLGEDGPVVIDFPQAVDAASNRNARKLLIRDVDNLHNFLARSIHGYRRKPFAEEMWALYERGELTPDTELRGLYREDSRKADVGGLLREIEFARRDAARAGLTESDEPLSTEEDGHQEGPHPDDGAPAPSVGGRRRRVEVVMSPPARAQGRPGTSAANSGASRGGRSAPGKLHEARGGAGREDPGARRDSAPSNRPPRRGRRREPAVDTAALLAAQPVLTEEQAAKAAQIAQAVRASQEARTAQGDAPTKKRRRRNRGGSPERGAAAETPRPATPPRTPSKSGDGRQKSTKPGSTGPSGSSEGASPKRRRRRRRGKKKPPSSGEAS